MTSTDSSAQEREGFLTSMHVGSFTIAPLTATAATS